MSDFVKDKSTNLLQCPKCDKILKHIGVDYDKPSEVYHCKQCSHTFQDVIIKARCNGCDNNTNVEFLAKRTIKNYTITPKGEFSAMFGVGSYDQPVTEIPGTFDARTFRAVLIYESERMKIAGIQCIIACMRMENIGELYEQIGRDVQKDLLTDLTRLVRKSLRPIDVICYEDSATILFMLPESNYQYVRPIMKQMCDLAHELVNDNFGFDAQVAFNIREFNSDKPSTPQLEGLIKNLLPYDDAR